MYDVIKYVTVIKSNKDDSIVFKDTNGKVYFLDKRYNKGIEKIKLGDSVLVWVRKEMDKVGYVALEINGLDIKSYIKKFGELTLDNILTIEPKVATNKTRLSNDIYNYDIDFRIKSSIDDGILLLPFAKDIIAFYDKVGINSEISEYRYGMVFMLCYLYEKFCINDMILESHDLIAKVANCYSPNVIEISDDGLTVNYYHGLEEGLMCWDSIPVAKLKKELVKG